MIGSFGDIIFEASNDKIATVNDFIRSCTGRWGTHDTIGKKSKLEYIGPGVDEISFSMYFSVSFGVNPRNEMNRLLIKSRAGEAETLIIGGLALGVHKWIIESVKQSWLTFDGQGNLWVGQADVVMKEYY